MGKNVSATRVRVGLFFVLATTAVFPAHASTPEMVRVPAGAYFMGSKPGEPGREGDEAPRHAVTLAKAFYVSKFEITQEQWETCASDASCRRLVVTGTSLPVVSINWNEAKAYTVWLSKKTGQKYRLLTEAEWEYAARAGLQTAYTTGDTLSAAAANFAASNIGKAVAVGSYPPNAFGLYDMHGNVWEWVEDCYNRLGYYGAPADGTAVTREACEMHVVRGGAFDTLPQQMRFSYRLRLPFGSQVFGFRVARDE